MAPAELRDPLIDRPHVAHQLFGAVPVPGDGWPQELERQQRCAAVVELSFHVLWKSGKVRGGHGASIGADYEPTDNESRTAPRWRGSPRCDLRDATGIGPFDLSRRPLLTPPIGFSAAEDPDAVIALYVARDGQADSRRQEKNRWYRGADISFHRDFAGSAGWTMSTTPDRGGGSERGRLIESHLPLVRGIAARYVGRGEPLEDLVQVGSVALIRAGDRFDPDRGVTFAAFAAPAVEGEIRRHLGDRSGSVHVPRQLRRMTGELARSRAQLAASLGRPPSLPELASALGVDRADVERALEAERAREPAPAVAEETLEAAGGAGSVQSSDDRLSLARVAGVLDERERRIVFLRFHADLTEREIAREVGISQAQVSRLLARALATLRRELDQDAAAPGAGDIAEESVISPVASQIAAEVPAPDAQQRQPEASGGIKLPSVGALEEKGGRGASVEDPPEQDLAMPYHVTVKAEGEGRAPGWSASLDELPGCEARGDTPDQAVENLRVAMQGWLSAAADEPRVISPPRSARRKKASSHSGRFLVRMPSALHEELTRAAEREQVSLNRFVTSQLAAAVAPSGGRTMSDGPTALQPSNPVAPAARRRRFRVLLAANLAVVILAAGAAITLLILALERGI
jgi:RNA polymerase sigma-B factor